MPAKGAKKSNWDSVIILWYSLGWHPHPLTLTRCIDEWNNLIAKHVSIIMSDWQKLWGRNDTRNVKIFCNISAAAAAIVWWWWLLPIIVCDCRFKHVGFKFIFVVLPVLIMMMISLLFLSLFFFFYFNFLLFLFSFN